jgi:hypothetical protein
LRELQAADPSTRACSAPNSKQSRTRRSHSQVAVFEKLPQAACPQIYQICLPELISARILTAVQNGGSGVAYRVSAAGYEVQVPFLLQASVGGRHLAARCQQRARRTHADAG